MPERIPQSIAKRVVLRAISSTDHFTPTAGLTLAVTISKNGGAFANPAAGATNATGISSGYYYFDLGTGDTGTSGPLAWRAAGAGADDIGDVYEVVAATNAGFTALPAVAAGSSGGVPVIGTGANTFKSDASANVTVATASVTAISDATWDVTLGSHLTVGSTGAALSSAATNLDPNTLADAVLNRDLSAGTDSGSSSVRTLRQAVRFLRNKWSIAGDILTVTKEDDVTTSWTATLTTTSGANPVTAVDPAGP